MPHTPRAAAAPAPAGPGTGGNPVGARKQALRARVRTGRRARTPQQRRADAERVAALLLALPEVTSARCVAAYTSTPVEPGTGPLRAALRAAGTRVLLPVALPDGVLDWAEDDGRTRPGHGPGGEEPVGPGLGPDAVRQAGVLIVPALAVDTRGARLGHGGGYYDRSLARLEHPVPVIAVVHGSELLDADVDPVPVTDHDLRVHIVVTPEGTRRLPPGGSGEGVP